MTPQPLDSYVSLVVLVRDCAPRVELFVAEAANVLAATCTNYEIVLIEDGSKDDSFARCQAILTRIDCLRVMRFARNFGDEAAYWAGLDNAIGDIVVLLSCAAKPTRDISLLVDACCRGSGVAAGVEAIDESPGVARQLLARIFHWYASDRLRVAYVPGSHYTWAFSRTAVNALLSRPRIPRLLRFNAAQLGIVPEVVRLPADPTHPPRRRVLLYDIMAGLSVILAHSLTPFRLVCLSGIVATAIFFGGSAFFTHSGSAVLLSVMTGGMLILLFMAILLFGEYAGRHLTELSGRRDYVIVSEHVSNVTLRDPDRPNVVNDSTRT